MTVPKFDMRELEVVGRVPAIFGEPIAVYNYPAAPVQAYKAMFDRRPIWQIAGGETGMFNPRIIPDNIARALVFEAETVPPEECGGEDMFGVQWEYMPQSMGSMVRPGNPLLSDANEWYDKVIWPDVDSWDWKGCAERNAGRLDKNKYNTTMLFSGWFERLISFMDFEGAIMALVDDDQKPAVKELFERLSGVYIEIIDKFIEFFPELDGFCIHDDWGGQKDTFFSPEVVREMIVPAMQKVTEHIHGRGRQCDLHSCGRIIKQTPNIIAAGWDSWIPQEMNDTHKIYELYGDKLIIAVIPEPFDPDALSEEEQRARAREFAEKFCNPGKPCTLSHYMAHMLTPAFREELYMRSRLRFGG
ncbi:MAG: methyltransferase [Oscillospiraceae bacterium]|nr:methyltransferase [Oscillospiraceae bacterium]